jgi:cell wall-associated NlpC family hydrolase
MIFALLTTLLPGACGQDVAPLVMLDTKTRPAQITSVDLADFPSLPDDRRKLIEGALAVTRDGIWLPYLAGGADPAAGGFDCSGAMYFVMRLAGLDPPRSSPGQMAWLKENGRLHEVPADAVDLKHPSLAALRPGDLLFWAQVESPGVSRVHHVAMYLGTEKKDGRPVMINSTDGRSYRGQKANGYGVFDFRVSKPESPSKLVGYGTPPGIMVE